MKTPCYIINKTLYDTGKKKEIINLSVQLIVSMCKSRYLSIEMNISHRKHLVNSHDHLLDMKGGS